MVEHAELQELDKINVAGRNEPGEPARQIATVPGKVRKANQRARLRPDTPEGDVVEVVGLEVADHGLEIQADDMAKSASRIFLAGHQGESTLLHAKALAKPCLAKIRSQVMAHFEQVHQVQVFGDG